MSAEAPAKPRIISFSEINAWRQCQRRYHYAYDLKLDPITKGPALNKGIIGHNALRPYFEYLIEHPGDFDNAANDSLLWLAMFMGETNKPSEAEAANVVMRKLNMYYPYFAEKYPDLEVLETEAFHTVDLIDQFSYGFTLDTLWRHGPISYLNDFKWTYNFWTQANIDTKGNAQLAKYYWACKQLGLPVDRVILSEIRYREKKDPYLNEEQFRETDWIPTTAAQKQLMIEHVRTSREIIQHRQLPADQRADSTVRNLGAACDYCPFTSLCIGDLNGEDTQPDIDNYFQPKTYDYNKPEDGVVVGENIDY